MLFVVVGVPFFPTEHSVFISRGWRQMAWMGEMRWYYSWEREHCITKVAPIPPCATPYTEEGEMLAASSWRHH